MANKYLVHIVNAVSGWVVTQVHVIAGDDETAIDKALESFGLPKPDVHDAIKCIPQVIGTVADEAEQTAVQAVESEPVPETIPEAISEAERVAAAVLASLPADVIAAIKAKA